jgi:hypothetical protein
MEELILVIFSNYWHGVNALLIAQGTDLNLIINAELRCVPFVAHFREQIGISPPFSIFI